MMMQRKTVGNSWPIRNLGNDEPETVTMGELVTFDFDDTLTLPIKDEEGYWLSGGHQPNMETIEMVKEMDGRGHDIAIVTSRTRTPGSDQKIGAFIMEYELPVTQTVFTNGQWKADILEEMGSVLHYDDDLEELSRIEEKGIAVVEVPHPPGPRR